MKRFLITLAGLAPLLCAPAMAQTTTVEEAPEPPPLPPKKTPSETLEAPMVTIRTDEEGQVVEEYRQNGVIYMVKVTPENAPPYYLYDPDGDGNFESDMEPKSPVEPVYWKVAEWD